MSGKWGPGVDSAPGENECLRVKAAGVWGEQPHHLHVPNVVEILKPKPPGTLWATPGLLRESFTFMSGQYPNDIYIIIYCLSFSLKI
jgi:hypothetical protein